MASEEIANSTEQARRWMNGEYADMNLKSQANPRLDYFGLNFLGKLLRIGDLS